MGENQSSNVVTHARFGAAEVVEKLVGQNVIVADETRDYSKLDIPEPGYGEQVVGELNPDERILFFSMYDAKRELEDLTRQIIGNQIARLGETIRDSDRTKPLQQAIENGELEMRFANDEEAVQYFRLEKQANMLHALFHWQLAERFERHNYVLGVRTKGRVVATEKRH